MDFQRRILTHCLTPNEDGILPYSTIVYSCPKKSGKSAIAAAVGAWSGDEFPGGSELFVAAGSQEQAGDRIFRDIKFHLENSPKWEVREENMLLKYLINYPNETFIKVLAKNYKTGAGSRHALSLWDELWGFVSENDRRMWDELTPIPTVKNSIQFISTYSGFENESELLWDLYLQGVGKDEHPDGQGERVLGLEDLPCWSNGRLFVYWDHDNRMPWQTEQYLDQQFKSLRGSVYLRLHENRWVSAHEEFLPAEWHDRAATPPDEDKAEDSTHRGFPKDAVIWKEHPYKNFPVFFGLDAATKHDCIAGVGVCYDARKGDIIQLAHRIWTPVPGEVFDFEQTIEPWILDMKRIFPGFQLVAYDPKDMHQTAVRLAKQGIHMLEYPQTPANMVEASHALYEVLRANNFRAYPSVEMRDHIRMAVAEAKGRGFVIKKDRARSARPIDATIALAMATKLAIDSGGVDAGVVTRIESNFSERSQFRYSGDPAWMPWQFRSDD